MSTLGDSFGPMSREKNPILPVHASPQFGRTTVDLSSRFKNPEVQDVPSSAKVASVKTGRPFDILMPMPIGPTHRGPFKFLSDCG